MSLKPVLGGLRIVALIISSHIEGSLSISEGSVFPDYSTTETNC